jgi:cyclopropane fatty-acyl-phospholipid synthase-like methyltransferase
MNISNKDVDWAKHYDYYEVEMREVYKTVSKPQNDSHFEMLRHKANSYLTKDKVFCEIGFSAGLTLRHALPHFGKVYGLDISPRNVEFTHNELIEEGYSNFELFTFDLMKSDDRFNNKFDVISFIHGLEHFSMEDYPIILANIKKYLKPTGIFTGALPFKNNFNYRMCPSCYNVFEIDGHVSSHDIKSLAKVFYDNGFKVIHLDNFNLSYSMKHGNLLKRIYRYLYYYILNKRSGNQIEYVVLPVENLLIQ